MASHEEIHENYYLHIDQEVLEACWKQCWSYSVLVTTHEKSKWDIFIFMFFIDSKVRRNEVVRPLQKQGSGCLPEVIFKADP